jgi:hypothetical protein
VSGASLSAEDGISYEGFRARIRGQGLTRDLSKYQVVPTADGFQLSGVISEDRRGGKIKLVYDVIGTDFYEAGIHAIVTDDDPSGTLDVKQKLIEKKQLIDTLRISVAKDEMSDSSLLPALDSMRVKEKIKIKGDYFLQSTGVAPEIHHSFSASPEPTTASMLAAGLAGLAAAGHRRSRQPARRRGL